MSDQLPYIITDEPLDKHPQFGFEGYAKTIADLIANPKNQTPLVIGIYGAWGTGKTTLMKTVESRLQQQGGIAPYRPCKTVWFQAWKYAEEEAILAALIEEIFKSMESEGGFTWSKGAFEKLAERFNMTQPFQDMVKALTGGTVDIGTWFSSLEYKAKLGFYDVFQRFFDRLLWAYVTPSGLKTGQEFDDRNGVLVIFIDDLDRCPKERVLKVLETMKLFLDKKGCVFVIGAAREVIESALQQRYDKPGEAQQFMDKIVQVTFALPKVPGDDLKTFIASHVPDNTILHEFTPVLARVLNYNVRAVKRFLNDLSLSHGFVVNADPPLDISPDALMRWSILQYAYPGLAKLIKDSPQHIPVMNETVKALEDKGLNGTNWNLSEEKVKEVQIPASLREFIAKRELVDLMKGFPTQAHVLESIVSLSATATSLSEEVQPQESRGVGSEMAKVPKGSFLYGEDKKARTIDQDYLIDIFPVTNEQYRHFLEKGGYQKKELWLEEGWKWKEQERVSQPLFWEDEKWNKPDHPVVGVSWFEAEAYAKWAGKRLPSEEEWEKAARGTEGREYPWGDEFDKEKCNSEASGFSRTTSVTKYVNGLSPYGCYDMAGNVWEWTESWYNQDQDTKVIRGGSWSLVSRNLRAAYRNGYWPTVRANGIGFRCAQGAR
jgi:iron(II)-dependent oxidoreductase